MPSKASPPDYDELAEVLVALGYPARLQLLDRLRFPHTLGDIRLSPSRADDRGSTGRPAARQTVQHHLDTLVEAGFLRSTPVEKQGKQVPQYVVNPQKLYAVLEDLRRLSTIYAGRGTGFDATGTMAPQQDVKPMEGPRLVLVHGVYEGKSFPLDPAAKPERRWIIGRGKGSEVHLDYDPFVSTENSAVTFDDGAYAVQDLKGKNGTWVNWNPLPRGAARVLRAGDVIGVGRSLLSFVPA